MRCFKRLFLLLCVLVMLTGAFAAPAEQEHAAAQEAVLQPAGVVEQYRQRIADGNALYAEGTVSLRRARMLTDTLRELLNRLFKNMSLSLWTGSGVNGFELKMAGQTGLLVQEENLDQGFVTQVNDALFFFREPVLAGDAQNAFSMDALLLYEKTFKECAAPAIHALLLSLAEPVVQKGTNSFSYAGKSVRREVFTLEADAANSLLPRLMSALSVQTERIIQWASGYSFAGSAVFTVYSDREDAPVALGVKGSVKKGDTVYSLQLQFAAGSGGCDLSLSLKDDGGKDRVTISFSRGTQYSKNSATFTFTLRSDRRLGKDRKQIECDISFADKQGDEEKISGKVNQSVTQNGQKTSWRLVSDLIFPVNGEDLSGRGTIDFVHRTGDTVDLSGDVTLTRVDCITPVYTQGPSAAADEETQRMLLDTALLRAFAQLTAALPEGDRLLLSHELRGKDWHTMFAPQESLPEEWAAQ